MATQLVKRATAAATGLAMLVSVGIDRAGADTGPGEASRSAACGPVAVDPVSRQYLELGIIEVPGGAMGTVPPSCAGDGQTSCYQPVLDPVSRENTELRIVENPWVEIGPDLPTCAPDPS